MDRHDAEDHRPDRRQAPSGWTRRTWLRWATATGPALGPAAAATATTARPAAAPATGPGLFGYYPWWLQDHWRDRPLSAYRRIAFFEVAIQGDGDAIVPNGWPARWAALRQATRRQAVPVDVTFTLFDRALFERVFTSRARRDQLLATVQRLAGPADGIHLDFEVFDAITAAAVAGFRAFCADLRDALDASPARRTLSAFGVMGAATDLFDAATLRRMDHVVVQGYDSHHAGSRTTGPVAPLGGPYAITWETAVAHYGRLGLAPARTIVGFPFYGYEWTAQSPEPGARVLGVGRTGTLGPVDAALLPDIRLDLSAMAATHGRRRDPASDSPYYAYRDDAGQWRQGWFEDETSLAAKLAFVRARGLGGVAVFPIGYDAGRLEGLLQRALSGSRS